MNPTIPAHHLRKTQYSFSYIWFYLQQIVNFVFPCPLSNNVCCYQVLIGATPIINLFTTVADAQQSLPSSVFQQDFIFHLLGWCFISGSPLCYRPKAVFYNIAEFHGAPLAKENSRLIMRRLLGGRFPYKQDYSIDFFDLSIIFTLRQEKPALQKRSGLYCD